MTVDPGVCLRPVETGDLPRLFVLQLDPESNRMAVTIPRNREAFDADWTQSLGDPAPTASAIVFNGLMVGCIFRFPADGLDHVGYWIERVYWVRGIASRALRLRLREVGRRPLLATAATSREGVRASAPEVRLRRRESSFAAGVGLAAGRKSEDKLSVHQFEHQADAQLVPNQG